MSLSFLSSKREEQGDRYRKKNPLILSTFAAATNGEEASFRLICKRYTPLFKRLWRSCSVENLDYDDWYQECCLITVKVLKLCQNDQWRHFGWALKRSCIRRAYDLYRERGAVKRIPKDSLEPMDDLTDLVLISNNNPSVEEIIDTKEGMKLFWDSCSPFERKIFAGIQCGQTVNELAHRYECRPSSIRSAHSRCHKKLKNILNRC